MTASSVESFVSDERNDASFRDLMQRRVTEILLVSSHYDHYIMEEDGGLVEQISSTYLDLHLSRAPRLHHASTAAEGLSYLSSHRPDLVITTRQIGAMDAATFGRAVKARYPDLPIVLLLHRMSEVMELRAPSTAREIDRIFVWSGDSSVFLAIIKSIEDRMNVDRDIATAHVRVIILLEDSPLYYSSFLPLLYSEIMRHCQALLPEDINTMHRLYRMRARPKVLLARTCEEAHALFAQYSDSVLAVISDVEVPCGGALSSQAGLALCHTCRAEHAGIPFLFLSADERNRDRAYELGAGFISKSSPTLSFELRDFIVGNLGFGDFVFRMEDGREVGSASNLMQMQQVLERIPDEALQYHLKRHHFANWFLARGEFALAELVERRASAFGDGKGLRTFLCEALAKNAVERRKGRISDFSSYSLRQPSYLMRLGRGSLGGKARGLAFMAHLMSRYDFSREFPGVVVRIPRTVIVSAGKFDRFIELNHLRSFVEEASPDEEVARVFLGCRLHGELADALEVLLRNIDYPLAVRSSSLLEDSHEVPFAGVYSTYMLPNNHPSIDVRREQLHRAVKLVYASVFFESARKYMESVNVRLGEEKMAIVIQEIVGQRHGRRFYPDISGVAQSWDYYASHSTKPEEGVAHIAMGFGRIVTDDGLALRFCPAHPAVLPQLGTIDDYFEHTQKEFYALDVGRSDMMPVIEDGAELVRCGIACAEEDGVLQGVGAVYSAEDDAIRDGLGADGPRLVTFGAILKHDSFPLPRIVERLLALGQQGMGTPVDIEFAVNLPTESRPGEFCLL